MLGYIPRQTPPPPDTTGYGVNKQALRILLECILVGIKFSHHADLPTDTKWEPKNEEERVIKEADDFYDKNNYIELYELLVKVTYKSLLTLNTLRVRLHQASATHL